MRTYETVYLAPSASSAHAVTEAWKISATVYGCKGRPFVPHMTLRQASRADDSINFLTYKAEMLLRTGLTWSCRSFVFFRKDERDGGKMKIADTVSFGETSMPLSIAQPLFPTFEFSFCSQSWVPRKAMATADIPGELSIASYNVLHDSRFPFDDRIDAVVSAILVAEADVVALQEVTDDSLRLLLATPAIQQKNRWCTRGTGSILETPEI